MRTCTVRAARHNRGECQTLGPMANHEVFQLNLYLALGHTRLHESDDMGKRRVSDGLRRLHTSNLVRILHTAKAHNEVRRLAQLHIGKRFGESALKRTEARKRNRVLDAERVRFASHKFALTAECGRCELRMRDTLVAHFHHTAMNARRFLASFGVARVGVQHRSTGRNEHRMRVLLVEHAVESRKPLDIRRLAYEKRVDLRVSTCLTKLVYPVQAYVFHSAKPPMERDARKGALYRSFLILMARR